MSKYYRIYAGEVDLLFAYHVEKVYLRLRGLGLVRSQREFCRRWLGRAETMLRDMIVMRRWDRIVRQDAVDRLRDRLIVLSTIVPNGVAREVLDVVAEIDRDLAIVRMLRVGR